MTSISTLTLLNVLLLAMVIRALPVPSDLHDEQHDRYKRYWGNSNYAAENGFYGNGGMFGYGQYQMLWILLAVGAFILVCCCPCVCAGIWFMMGGYDKLQASRMDKRQPGY